MNDKILIKRYMKLKKLGFSNEVIVALYPEFIRIIDKQSVKLQCYFLTANNSNLYYDYLINPDNKIKILADIVDTEVNHFNDSEIDDTLKIKLNKLGHTYNCTNNSLSLRMQVQQVLTNSVKDPNLLTFNEIKTLFIFMNPMRFLELGECTALQAAIAINFDSRNLEFIDEGFLYSLELINRQPCLFNGFKASKRFRTVEEYLKYYNYDTSTDKDSLWFKYNLKAHVNNPIEDCDEVDDLLYALVFKKDPNLIRNPKTLFAEILMICKNSNDRDEAIDKICELYNIHNENSKISLEDFCVFSGSGTLQNLMEINNATSERIEEIYKTSTNGIVKLKCVQVYPQLCEKYELSRLEYYLISVDSINALDSLDSIPSSILSKVIADNPVLIEKINRVLTIDELEMYLSNVIEIPKKHEAKILSSIERLSNEERESLISLYDVISDILIVEQ